MRSGDEYRFEHLFWFITHNQTENVKELCSIKSVQQGRVPDEPFPFHSHIYNAHIFMLIWCTALLLIKWFIESIFFCFFLISTENIIKSIFPPRDRNSLTKYSQLYVCDDHGIEFVIIFLFMPNRNCVYKEHLLHTMLVTMLCVCVVCIWKKFAFQNC